MKTFIQDKHQEQAIKSLQRIIRIPSYLQEGIPGAPFGQDILECLQETVALFKEEGFETFIDPEGYYGYAEIGEGADIFGILCHLDVVPAGAESLWKTPAYEGTIKDGVIYGRGVLDDKGPTIASLYAVKSLVEAGVSFNKKIRFIFGTDEENLWRCMERYHQKEVPIDLGIAPDAKFPLIFAEKGLMQVYLTGPGSSEVTVTGGGALNVVPDRGTYNGKQVAELSESLTNLGYEFTVTNQELTVTGQAIHSKNAHLGVNAITRLAEGLSKITSEPVFEFLGQRVGSDGNGVSTIGLFEDEVSGKLTFNVATLEVNELETKIGIDIRMPVTTNKEEVVLKLQAVAQEFGLTYHEHDYIASLYVPKDSELVTSLLGAYRDMTGDMAEPQVSGGATFARTMPNCVAFGAGFDYTKDTIHQANEEWQLTEMRLAMEIYAEAIYRLCSN